jgi:hypothetical protein
VPLLILTTKADGLDPAAHVPKIQNEMNKTMSLDDMIVAYEQIPIKATTDDKAAVINKGIN